MTPDRSSLEIVAPALSTGGSLIALFAALFGSERNNAAVFSALLGTIGSVAWLATAIEDQKEAAEVPDLA